MPSLTLLVVRGSAKQTQGELTEEKKKMKAENRKEKERMLNL